MEFLRTTPHTAEYELAGTAPSPEIQELPLIAFPEYNPTASRLELGADLHSELRILRGRKEKASLYYYDHESMNGIYASSQSPFTENGNGVISLEFDEPAIDPQNSRRYLPKNKSVALIAQFTRKKGLPNLEILRYLFEHRAYHTAADLIVVENPNSRYAFARTNKSPNADRKRAIRIPQNMYRKEEELFYKSQSKTSVKAIRATVLDIAAKEGYFAMFYGSPNNSHLTEISPRDLAA